MNSLYRWEGQIQDDQEVVLITKTTAENVPELKEKVKATHSIATNAPAWCACR